MLRCKVRLKYIAELQFAFHTFNDSVVIENGERSVNRFVPAVE
jgi:hypothetical protein